MVTYEIIEVTNPEGNPYTFILRSDGALIPMDERNADYQAYLNKDKAEHFTPMVASE